MAEQQNRRQEIQTVIAISVISLLVFVPFLGALPLFDWDEVNFAEAAREMILSGDYSRVRMDFAPFWEKPPMFFWMQALSMHLWGIGAFAARFPNAICGVITLIVIYLIGRRLYDHRFGVLWVLAYGGSILPHLYFRSGIIDPWFNLLIFLSLYFFIRNEWRLVKKNRKHAETQRPQREEIVQGSSLRPLRLRVQFFNNHPILTAGILLGLAVLTKGPVAYLIVLLVVGAYWAINRFNKGPALLQFIVYSIIALATFGIWYGVETITHGPWFIVEFTRYQFDLLLKPGAGHSGFPGYHVVVLFLGCFPASIFALRPLFKETDGTEHQVTFKRWMQILLIVVVVLFSLVQSKIVHYSSLCYFPITFLATVYAWQIVKQGRSIGRWQSAGLIVIGMLYAVAGIAVVILGRSPEIISSWIELDQNARSSISMDIAWEWWRVLPVVCILMGIASILFLPSVRTRKAVVVIYVCAAAFTYTGIVCWVGKVQQYTQGPATEFFASLAGKDVYVIPWGHKSYSQYWDFRKPLPKGYLALNSKAEDNVFNRYSDPDFLLNSQEVEKDVYVITKVSKADEFLRRFSDVQKIGQEGGFVFFVRRARLR